MSDASAPLENLAEILSTELARNRDVLTRIAVALERIAGSDETSLSPHPSPQATVADTLSSRKQAALDLLQAGDSRHWSDREIARRAGVSAQSVGNWRKQMIDEGTIPEEDQIRQAFRNNRPYEIATQGIGKTGKH